ncbi:hypothetical protein [Amycolatopsis sp. 195334CR]|nr:hypothetical protein [Amycolatopsis sp. 195334CR]
MPVLEGGSEGETMRALDFASYSPAAAHDWRGYVTVGASVPDG